MDANFSRSSFQSLPDRQARDILGAKLAGVMSARLRSASSFRHEVHRCVQELRALGHDLWSFEESDEFQTWGPNYVAPTGPGIVVTFSAPDGVEVEWAA